MCLKQNIPITFIQKDDKFIEYTKKEKGPSMYIAISDAETGKVETLSEQESFFAPVVTLTQDKNGNIVTSKENVYYELYEKDKDQLMRDVDAVKEYNDAQNSDNLYPKFSSLDEMRILFPRSPEIIPVAPESLRRNPELERLRGVSEMVLHEPCGVVQEFQPPKGLGSIDPKRIQEILGSLSPKRRK